MITFFRTNAPIGIGYKIVESIEWDLHTAYQHAFHAGQRESAMQLLRFVNDLISKTLYADANDIFHRLYPMPCYFFNEVEKSEEFRDQLVDYQSISYKTKGFIFKALLTRQADNIIANQNKVESLYLGVISFYHIIAVSEYYSKVVKYFSQFNEMGTGLERMDHSIRARFLNSNPNLNNPKLGQVVLNDYKIKLHNDFFFDITHRRVALCLKSWFIYLHSLGRISTEHFNSLDSAVRLRYHHFEDLIDDINYINDHESDGYLGLGEWDHTKRESGAAYEMPSTRYWIMLGVTLILLKSRLPVFDIRFITYRKDLRFLTDEFIKITDSIGNELDRWKGFLGLNVSEKQTSDMAESFELRAREFRTIISQIKNRVDQFEVNNAITSKLNEQKLVEFKEAAGEAWQENYPFKLFYFFDTVSLSSNKNGLTPIGESILLEKARRWFTSDEHIIVDHIGTDLGHRISRYIESFFLRTIYNQFEEQAEFDSPVDAIQFGIHTLIDNEVIPNLIILPPELSYDDILINSSLFAFSQELTDEHRAINALGYFNGILVATLYVSNLRNQIICCNFNDALGATVFESNELYAKQLHIDLRDLTSSEIEAEFDQGSEKWIANEDGTNVDPNEGKKRVASSIIFEAWCWGKIEIKNRNAISVTKIKQVNE